MQLIFECLKLSRGGLSLKQVSNTLTQVRHHSKIYPWRQNRKNRECYLDTSTPPYTDRHNINEFRSSKRQKKEWQKVIPKEFDNRYNAFTWNTNYKSDPKEAKETAQSKLQRFQDSVRDRGSARETKPYTPPDDVQETILSLLKGHMVEVPESSGLDGLKTNESILDLNLDQARQLKFNLIAKCIEEFRHDMPGSYLNDVVTIRDVVEYFSTPVRGINPYNALLRNQDSLPANLSLIAEPIRYNVEQDEMFGGKSAYPGVVSKVPGIRGSKKFPILNQSEFQWPDV